MGPLVETCSGTVKGTTEDGVHVFRGSPSPDRRWGRLRLAPPAPPNHWTGVRDAVEFGPVSHQMPISLGFMGAGKQPPSEDCLALNVWTPGLDGGRRPVMVFLHGGAFVIGAGSEPLYNGHRLATQGDVVVVTANYRLGALGYLAHPCLRDELTGACGNWGPLDHVAALEWVSENPRGIRGRPRCLHHLR